jgi:hypothetical protein
MFFVFHGQIAFFLIFQGSILVGILFFGEIIFEGKFFGEYFKAIPPSFSDRLKKVEEIFKKSIDN